MNLTKLYNEAQIDESLDPTIIGAIILGTSSIISSIPLGVAIGNVINSFDSDGGKGQVYKIPKEKLKPARKIIKKLSKDKYFMSLARMAKKEEGKRGPESKAIRTELRNYIKEVTSEDEYTKLSSVLFKLAKDSTR